MNYNLKYWTNYLVEDQTRRFDRNKDMLKVLLVNQKSDDALFNYFNFSNFKEIISFLKLVILPSITISNLVADDEHVFFTAKDFNETIRTIEELENNNDKLINLYKNMYSRLEDLENENIDIRILVEITEELNYIYNQEHQVFLIVEFSDCIETYFRDIYRGYKANEELDILEESLEDTLLPLNKFKEAIDNIEKIDQDDLEEFLYQIPIL